MDPELRDIQADVEGAQQIGVQFGPMSPEQREAIYSSRAEKIVLPKAIRKGEQG